LKSPHGASIKVRGLRLRTSLSRSARKSEARATLEPGPETDSGSPHAFRSKTPVNSARRRAVSISAQGQRACMARQRLVTRSIVSCRFSLGEGCMAAAGSQAFRGAATAFELRASGLRPKNRKTAAEVIRGGFVQFEHRDEGRSILSLAGLAATYSSKS
jgi:hypothetical protein